MIGKLIGHYRVLREIARGGVGIVYEAAHETLPRRVAIKLLQSYHATEPALVTRLCIEARASAQVGHPGVVTVEDFGSLDDGVPYLVMELVPGESLARRLSRGPLAPDEHDLVRQVAEVMAAAHERGIIHRDLSPSNIMLPGGPGPRVKVLDFGLAKVTDDLRSHGGTHVHTMGPIGTFEYVPPEQWKNPSAVTDRADVYALGVILYESLAGKRPFAGPLEHLLYQHLFEPPPPLSGAGVSAELAALCLAMLAKAPEDRPSMREVAARMQGARQRPARLLYLYAPKDEEFLDGMDEHLSPLRRTGVLESWDQSRVVAGGVISEEVEAKLRAADIVVPLVSASFVNDDGCDGALQRAMAAGKLAIPVLVRLVRLDGLPIGLLKSLPSNGRPVVLWTDRDSAWVDIVNALAERLSAWRPPVDPAPVTEQAGIVIGTVSEPRRSWVEPVQAPELPRVVVPAEFVHIEPGTFWMGSPDHEPGHQRDEWRHQVTITRGFLLGRTQVTQEQYKAVMGGNPSRFRTSAQHPVEQVRWLDAVAYCNKRSEQEGLPPSYIINGSQVSWPEGLNSRGYRLPTEAEWEYAARAGQGTIYAGSDAIDEVAWYPGNSQRQTHVWEWVWDWYGEYPVGSVTDPIGEQSGSDRVSRGGSFVSVPLLLRVAYRVRFSPGNAYRFLGLRLSRSLP